MKTLPNEVIQVLQGYYATLQDLEQPKQIEALYSILKKYKIALPQKAPAEPLILENVSLEKIEQVVCNLFGVTPQELKSKSRKNNLVIARQTVWYYSRQYLSFIPFRILSEQYERDHSTAHYGCKQISMLIETKNRQWLPLINQVYESLKQVQ